MLKMIFTERQLHADVFAIPVGEYFQLEKENLFLVYAPLAGETLIAFREDVPELTSALQNSGQKTEEVFRQAAGVLSVRKAPKLLPESPRDYRSMILMPTARCNFSCGYCYAAKAHSAIVLSEKKLFTALDYLLENQEQEKSILFSGGGEPMLEKDFLRRAVDYCKKKAPEQKISWTVNTNGSLIDHDDAVFFRENDIHPAVSFDILESVQKRTRGNWDLVRKKIKLLIKEGVIPSFTTTLIPETVEFLPQMAEEICREYPEVRHWTAEMATLPEISCEEMRAFHQKYITLFFQAADVFSGEKRKIHCAFEKMMENIRYRWCPGKLNVTPSGVLTICPLTSAPDDLLWQDEQYGFIDDETNSVSVDIERFKHLIHSPETEKEQCRSCFMRWNCAGGCHNQNQLFKSEIKDLYCHTVRDYGILYLLGKLDKAMKNNCSLSLKDWIKKAVEK